MKLLGRRLLLGVSGGIAVYKAADLARQLVKSGAEVTVVMTANAQKFVTPLTFRTITNKPVATELFADPKSPVPHISLAKWPDLILIAPATADLISRATQGRANDLLSAVILDSDAPVMWAPAMNTRMWQHPATRKNIDTLLSWGHQIVLPESGSLACGEVGDGRLASIETIVNNVEQVLVPAGPLRQKKILITAGPTREAWDSIRYLSNRSTGKMGYALAKEAQTRGAQVILISGPVNLEPPVGVECINVETAQEMFDRAMQLFDKVDIVIASAAVADFKPADPEPGKIKKSKADLTIKLAPNPDILQTMGDKKSGQILVGFAAESEEPVKYGKEKMLQKKCDLMIANFASGENNAFGQDEARQFIIDDQGSEELARQTKADLAKKIIDRLEEKIV